MFSATPADIAVFGGSAGPGKSWCLVHEPTRHAHVPGFAGAIFRRTAPELQGAGSVWEKATDIYPLLGATMREHRMDARFPSGALVEFESCQYDKDLAAFQSKEYCYLAWDELTHFTERMFWYLIGRNRSTCGVKPYARGATNPDFDSFLRPIIDWWIGDDGFPIPERSGVVRWMARVEEELIWGDTREEVEKRTHGEGLMNSFTFVAATLADNPTMLEKDPGYEARLNLLSRVDRERLKLGNWNVRPSAGDYFQRYWFEVIDAKPADAVGRVRFWDKGGGTKMRQNDDPRYAWTVGVLVSKTTNGSFVVEHGVHLQGRPREVEDAIKNTAKADGRDVDVVLWQDPGQAGATDVDNFVRLLAGWNVHGVPAREDKLTYAKPVSAQAERGNVKLVRGSWNERFLSEHENFPTARLKDYVDATSGAVLWLTDGAVATDIDAPDPDEGHRASRYA